MPFSKWFKTQSDNNGCIVGIARHEKDLRRAQGHDAGKPMIVQNCLLENLLIPLS
jgi:hypothetical protein